MNHRQEPASMTMGDVLVLVAGVAVAVVIVDAPLINPFDRSLSHAHDLFRNLIRFIQVASLAVSVVALGRVGLYRRMPSAPEWLGILVGCTLFEEWPWLNVDHWVYAYRMAFPPFDALSLDQALWLAAVFSSVVMAILLGLIHLGRRLYPAWIKTILLVGLALLAMTGPLHVFANHGANLISPRQGFWPGQFAFFHRMACEMIAALPSGLLFGLPTVAVLRERIGGRRWTWVEWMASLCSTFALFAFIMKIRYLLPMRSAAGLAERLMVLAWFAVVFIISKLILTYGNGKWSRWIGGPDDHDRSSSSASEPEASTR